MGRPSKISVRIISAVIGKTSEEITNSFVFDEAYRLARKGIDVHVIRRRVEGKTRGNWAQQRQPRGGCRWFQLPLCSP